MLVDVFSKGMLGSEAEKALGEAAITVNKNAIPFDTNPPMKPSGIRIGTPALTTRGMKEEEMKQVGRWISEALHHRTEAAVLGKIRNQVLSLAEAFPLYPERGRRRRWKYAPKNGGRASRPSETISGTLEILTGGTPVLHLLAELGALWLNSPVKVAIDIRRMTEFGVGTYTRNIVRALGRLDSESKYFLIGPPEKVAEIGPLPPNFHTVPLLGNDATIKNYFDYRAILKRLHCDLVHIPHLFWLPRNLPCPYVMTVHDVLDHMYRARDQSGFKRSLHFYLTHRALKGAARIFAVSNFTKSEVEKLFAIPAARTEVVYNAIDERFLRGHASDADRQLLAERYLVNHPFLLYTGRISPHKNVVRIIEAFSALKAELEKEGLFPGLEVDHHRGRAIQAS